MLFNNSENPENSFVVIEFKRPSRNDYDDEENPIDQVYEYIDKIRSGKAKYPNGQMIIITENTPCYVYIISDLTEKMGKYCRKNDFITTHDALGFEAKKPYLHEEDRRPAVAEQFSKRDKCVWRSNQSVNPGSRLRPRYLVKNTELYQRGSFIGTGRCLTNRHYRDIQYE